MAVVDTPDRRAIAIIPARGGSKRVPRKNLADICGRPMLAYPVEACLESGCFAEVIVSTEDAEIAASARVTGAAVDNRPAHLATDNVGAAEVCHELLVRRYGDKDRPESFCLVYAMAILLEAGDLRAAQGMLQGWDAVLGVSSFPLHPYKALTRDDAGGLLPMFPEENLRRSQAYPEAFASNGTFCWLRTAPFMERPTFYPERLRGHVIPRARAVDIDTPEDLDVARRMMQAVG